jgi:hypothetical protein
MLISFCSSINLSSNSWWLEYEHKFSWCISSFSLQSSNSMILKHLSSLHRGTCLQHNWTSARYRSCGTIITSEQVVGIFEVWIFLLCRSKMRLSQMAACWVNAVSNTLLLEFAHVLAPDVNSWYMLCRDVCSCFIHSFASRLWFELVELLHLYFNMPYQHEGSQNHR